METLPLALQSAKLELPEVSDRRPGPQGRQDCRPKKGWKLPGAQALHGFWPDWECVPGSHNAERGREK